MAAILVTGFGRFPGVPINPTAALVARLERCRRPALSDLCIKANVFATCYRAVDEDLPALISRAAPVQASISASEPSTGMMSWAR